jgi:hypothetical protein
MQRQRLACAAATLALLWVAAPRHSEAAPFTFPADSSACQLSTLIIQPMVPVGMVASTSLAPTSYNASGYGTCTGAGWSSSFTLSGGGTTIGAPTCTDFVSLNGGGLMTVGGTSENVSWIITGPTAAAQAVFETTSSLTTGGSGVVELSLTPASLLACMQPGGASSLEYSGTAVVVR